MGSIESMEQFHVSKVIDIIYQFVLKNAKIDFDELNHHLGGIVIERHWEQLWEQIQQVFSLLWQHCRDVCIRNLSAETAKYLRMHPSLLTKVGLPVEISQMIIVEVFQSHHRKIARFRGYYEHKAQIVSNLIDHYLSEFRVLQPEKSYGIQLLQTSLEAQMRSCITDRYSWDFYA